MRVKGRERTGVLRTPLPFGVPAQDGRTPDAPTLDGHRPASIWRMQYARVFMLAIAFALVAALAALAQGPASPKVWLQADRSTLTVGDQVRLVLFAQAPGDTTPQFPDLPAQWGALEVLGQSDRKPQTDKDGLVVSGREYVVTLFALGDYATPALEVSLRDAGGQTLTVSPEPLTLTVTSVLTDTETADIRDLQPQADLPFDWRVVGWVALGILGAAAVALLGVILARRLRRRPQPAAAAPEIIDTRPPEEIAYAELQRIEGLRLVAAGELKQHYSLAADCLRRYLGGVYGLPALDRTTDELARLLRRRRVEGGITRQALDILEESDFVKFARSRPSAEQAGSLLGRVRGFVDLSRPGRAPAETPGGQ